MSVNLLTAELEPGSERPGYAHRELQLRSLQSGARWGGTIYELRAGERICPYHWHAAEEEWLLVLSGAPTLRAHDGEQPLRPWDVVVFRRGPEGAHEVRNDTDATLQVLMLSTLSEPEICVYPDSGKIGAWHKAGDGTLTGLRNRPEHNLDYFDGEK